MDGVIAELHRYPIKGFTAEPVGSATLAPGEAFPCDRHFAVENGPSGFDPNAPGFIPKGRFVVLARSAAVATVHTRYDEMSDVLGAKVAGQDDFSQSIADDTGRDAFAHWLTPVLADDGAGRIC